MDALLSQVMGMAASATEATRKSVIVTLRDAANTLETPEDTMERIMFGALQIAAVRTGVDLKLFEILARSEKALSVEDLHNATGCALSLMGRLARYLASVGIVKESRNGLFAANNITKSLSLPGSPEGIIHYFDTLGPVYQAMPAYLKKSQFADITDANATVFQDAWKTSARPFEWLPQHPDLWNAFNTHLAARRAAMPSWLSVYPIEVETENWNPDVPVFVDIGGSIGYQCAEFKAKFPKIAGSIILQDLAYPIQHAIPTPGVETMVHDFFTPNPVRGAKFYYMHCILHDYPDDRCLEILANIKFAMGPESILLIDEMVLPSTNVHWQATQIDLTMMAALAAMERTEAQWHRLLDTAGFRIANTYVYTPSCHESVMAVVPK